MTPPPTATTSVRRSARHLGETDRRGAAADAERLLGLAGRQHGHGGAEAGGGQGVGRGVGVRADVLVADDEGHGARTASARERPQAAAVVADNLDVVTTFAQLDADRAHEVASEFVGPSPDYRVGRTAATARTPPNQPCA